MNSLKNMSFSRWAALQAPGGPGRTILHKNLVYTEGTLYEDFETVGDWTVANGTAVANAVEFKEGTQSIKLTSTDAATTTMTKTINTVFGSPRRFCFWLYMHTDPATTVTDAYFYLTSVTNFTKLFTAQLSNYPLVTGWNQIILPESAWSASGGESWNNPMVRMRLRLKAAAGQTAIMSFDDLRIGEVAQPAVLLTFDDGLDSVYSKAFAAMRPHRMRGTSFVITNNVDGGGSLSAEQVRTMYKAGWDMANHTASHAHLTTGGLSQQQIEDELTGAQTALEGWGCTRSSLHVAYPWGEYDATVQAAMTAVGAKTGRRTTSGSFMVESVTLHQIPIRNVNLAVALATVQGYIDTAVSRQNVVCLCFHGIADAPGADEWSTANFSSLMDYIASKDIVVLTMNDLYKLRSGMAIIPRMI